MPLPEGSASSVRRAGSCHFPAQYGEHMWDALLEAGKEFGIAPFGVEAQRVLRLEKKHIIPSQDTDLLSTPLDSDAEWVVRFDKPDFIGRAGLAAARDRGPRELLVGFVMDEPVVPSDGNAVTVDGFPVGTGDQRPHQPDDWPSLRAGPCARQSRAGRPAGTRPHRWPRPCRPTSACNPSTTPKARGCAHDRC